MIGSIELQIISKLVTSDNDAEVDALMQYDPSYYSAFKDHIKFIFDHKLEYGTIPDVFTFQAQFPDIELIRVTEPLSYLVREIKKNKQHIMLIETFNKLKDLGAGDVEDAWKYLTMQCDTVSELSEFAPMDIVKQARQRADQIKLYSQQQRIPTGFKEIDNLMHGGLSTVEELVLIVARTNTGKSWVCTKMMESAQGNGFPVLYYSPEMQASYLGTRFDTWRSNFKNSELYKGHYTKEYVEYLSNLEDSDTSAYILEDKDTSGGSVNVSAIEAVVKQRGIKLVIIDGLSYMEDEKRADSDYIRYKNICLGLFKISKKYGCAIVIAMQANRDTANAKDEKGEPFPGLYQVEGSDHPARICTQAFALRQIFDKQVLDIRLEKSRNANNQKPILSYAWDVNTGNMRYLPSGDADIDSPSMPTISPNVDTSSIPSWTTNDEDIDDDIEF